MDRFGKIYWMLLGFLIAVIIVLLALLIGGLDNRLPSMGAEQNPHTQESQPSDPKENALIVKSIEEQGDKIVVFTNYCQIKYPYAFSDLITVEAINDAEKTSLLFTALINGTKVKVYELTFGGQGSIPVGEITLVPGQAPVNVYATFYELEPNQSEDTRIAFVAAQETFNDVVASLGDNMNFVPVA